MGFEKVVGFRFDVPNNKEILYFLRKKVKGERLPHDAVGESDIYGDKEPWMIFDRTEKKQFFVFAKLKKKSKSESLAAGLERLNALKKFVIVKTSSLGSRNPLCSNIRRTRPKVLPERQWTLAYERVFSSRLLTG
jgi:hypothetical protein